MSWQERKTAKPKLEIIQAVSPKVLIMQSAADKMDIIIENSAKEVGWLCEVIECEDKTYLINDVFILEQDVHATTTEINTAGLTKFADELLAREDGVEVWNRIRGWGHSHVNMGVSPSGQDNAQMNLFTANGCEYFIRLIANKKGIMEIAFFDYRVGVNYSDVPWSIAQDEYVVEIDEQIEKLYKEIEAYQKAQRVKYEEPIKAELAQKVKQLGGYGGAYKYTAWNKKKEKPVQKKNNPSETKSKAEGTVSLDEEWVSTYITRDEMIEIGGQGSYGLASGMLRTYFPGWNSQLLIQIYAICNEVYDDWLMEQVTQSQIGYRY